MPNSTVQSFADPWEFQTAVQGSNLNVLVTARGEYQSKLPRIDMHQLRMQRGETSLSQISRAVVERGRNTIYFLADVHQAPIHQNGIELPPGVLVVSSPTAEHRRRMSTGSRWGSAGLTSEDLAAAGRALLGRDLTAPAETRLIRLSPYLMARLLNLHEAAGQMAATVPDILAHPEVSRAMEQELVHVMVQCLGEGPAVETNSRHRLPTMRRFEQSWGKIRTAQYICRRYAKRSAFRLGHCVCIVRNSSA